MDKLLVGLGVWLFCDSIISIRLYLKTLDETGKKLQSWKWDHSIRVIRALCAVVIIIVGAQL